MKADLHVHTNYSPCSKAMVEDVIKAAKMKGLDTIAVTDHNTIKGALMAKRKSKGLNIIIGCEKKCEYGELLLYNLKNEITSRKFSEIVNEARKQDAFIFIAHPTDFIRFNNKWKRLDNETLKLVDGVEYYNGRNLFNKAALKLSKHGVAGSDGHYAEEVGNTYVIYSKDLWKEIMGNKAKYFHKNSIFSKIKYLIKSFLNKHA